MDLFTPEKDIYSISRLNKEARYLLEESFPLIWVEGEISNFKHHSSGHMYFSLKDEDAEIDAVMFERSNMQLDFEPRDGEKVLTYSKVTIYERRGNYQLIVKDMQPAGKGRLQLKFQRLKEELEKEGLFATEHKKPVPPYPKRIALITSPEGAAIRDILTVIARRYPVPEILLFPTRVQGDFASGEIKNAIGLVNTYHRIEDPIDLIILSRGGGSLEDIWPFNEEETARAIYASKVPVISGVGHEVDFTISDFVSDLRAPTPSAAAETCVPDKAELLTRVRNLRSQITRSVKRLIENVENKLTLSLKSYAFKTVLGVITDHEQTIDRSVEKIIRLAKEKYQLNRDKLNQLSKRLHISDPQSILDRGYSLVENMDGEIIKSFRQVKVDEKVKVSLKEGHLINRILEASKDEE